MSHCGRRTALVAALALSLGGCPSAAPQAPAAQTAADEALGPAREAPRASQSVREAERMLSEGDAAGARAGFEQALAEDARDVRAHLGLGLAAEQLGDLAAAEKAYRAAVDIDGGFAEAHNNLGVLLHERGELPGAIRHFEQAIVAAPDLASAHANLAMAREDSGDLAGAKVAYEQALKLAPGEALVRVNFGLLLLSLKQADGAAREFNQALQAAGDNRAVLQAVGNGLRRAGEPQTAVKAMERALQAGDGKPTPALLSELALAQRAAKDPDAARTSLEQALKLDAKYATAHYLLGGMAASQREYRRAVGHYERYLKLAPDGPMAARAKKHLRAARALAERK